MFYAFLNVFERVYTYAEMVKKRRNKPGGVAEVFVRITDVCVDDTDEHLLILPVVTQLSEPVEVRRWADAFVIQLGDNITSVNIDDDQRSECYAIVFGQSATHQVHDVRQLRLQRVQVSRK